MPHLMLILLGIYLDVYQVVMCWEESLTLLRKMPLPRVALEHEVLLGGQQQVVHVDGQLWF